MKDHGEIRHGDTSIQYRVVRSQRRRKTIEIAVEAPGQVVVSAPANTPDQRIEDMVRRRASWIIQHDGVANAAPPQRRFVSGESLPYFGRAVQMTVRPVETRSVQIHFLHWHFEVEAPRRLEGEERRVKIRSAFEAWYRERAEAKLPPRVQRMAGMLGVRPKETLVSNQRMRWASCAPDETLRFNWRVIMAPPAIVDYLVAHELAHLRVRGHSPEYWAVVAQAIPEYRLLRAKLREIGPTMTI